ncbi:helix-turn-helix domain-containing protein [Flammeovirga yaeyamensis]|uniref:histidine kinase n=1 Tax=Flammeovirga yaeyamensis TaxID=367791 RepID=A0AAX1NEI6_9BACT|nr:helix-turn-helix domain-containing protein [Flammeovirga yaeyamensis]MBB3697072.1 signal transduction histidine kinase/ligand-binding sensor domain-containing protein/AraC-like DNA-binding protein [Flammeovirga yaeyamensis]NMF33734.1 helix-turn-helix domain-containing protein [Flammeovirga yaeyamensis]QWG05000.1 helix-turn-helix domain-containing protein [Flammeovirga yaeyamensis]
MAKFFKYILTYLFLLCSILAYCTPNKLPNFSGSVTNILQDKEGYMWFATWDGLYKYDGYELTVFGERNYQPLLDKKISAIMEHSNGKIWIGTDNNGIFIYDKKTDSFQHLTQDSESARTLNIKRITSFDEDNLGNIWIGTQGNGLAYYNINEKLFKAYTQRDFGDLFDIQVFQDLVVSVHYDKNGFVWFGTMQGLACMDIKTEEISLLEGTDYKGVYSIFQTEENEIWCSNKQGIFTTRFENTELKGEFVTHLINNKKSSLTPSPSKKNTLWFMTSNDVFTIDLKEKKLKKSKEFDAKSGFSTIFEDRSGVLWVGTHFGVYTLDLYKKPIRPLLNKEIDPVVTIEEHNGVVWAGTINGKLFYEASENEDGTGVYVQHPHRFEQISQIRYFDNNVWVSTVGKGIYILDEKTARIKKEYQLSDKIINPYVMSMVKSNYDDTFWIGCWDAGLAYFDASKDKFVSLNSGKVRELFNVPIVKIFPVAKGEIWLGTRGEGLWKINYTEDYKVTNVSQFNVKTPTMNTSLIADIVEKDHQTLLVATENGLFEFLRDRDHFSQKNIPNRLLKATISSLEKSADNTIWGTTLTYAFQWNDKGFFSFSTEDGLANERFYNNSKKITSKGNILFGGEKGIDILNIENFSLSPYDVFPIISMFYLNGEHIHPGEKVDTNILLDDVIQNKAKLQLNHDQNSFSFYLATLNYTKGDKKNFKYKLQGVDQDWKETTGENHVVRYNGLMPGKYTFQVKASNVDGKWSDQVKSIDITITPIWYKSIYAYVVYAILLLAIILFVMVWWRRRVHKANEEKYEHLKMRDERIEYERKVNFFTNLSHELRTPLTLVLGPIEQIAKNNKVQTELQEPLGIAFRNAQRLLRLTDQLMFLTKSQHGQMRLNIKQEESNLLIKDATDAFKHVAKKRNVNYSINYSEQLQPSVFIDKVMFEAVLYNILSNAFKYNVENGGVWVTTSTVSFEEIQAKFVGYKGNQPDKYARQYLRIEVKDSGIGIKKEDLESIFDRFYQVKTKNDAGSGIGLAFAKSIIEVMKGIIYVESEVSLGSKFTLLIPSDEDFYSLEEKENESAELVSKLLYSNTEKLQFDSPDEKKVEAEKVEKEELILIVEKSKEIQEYIGSILEKEYKIMFAENGLEAYEKVLKYYPSLVISEIYLEGMDGLQLTEKIKLGEKTKHTPVILLSSNPDTQERIKALESGSDSFIAKPFSPKHMDVRVHQLLKARSNIMVLDTKETKKKKAAPKKVEISFEDQVRIIIEKNLSEVEFSIPELAKELDMSNIQLYRKMKTETGMPPVEFVRNIRLQKALDLLKTSDLNISEIAYEVGFNDPQYFRKSFKKQFGQTPTQYRKPIKN